MRVLKKATREKVVFLPRFTMRNPVSNGLTCRQVVANDGVQSKSPICDKDMEEKRSPSTLYSMRSAFFTTVKDEERYFFVQYCCDFPLIYGIMKKQVGSVSMGGEYSDYV